MYIVRRTFTTEFAAIKVRFHDKVNKRAAAGDDVTSTRAHLQSALQLRRSRVVNTNNQVTQPICSKTIRANIPLRINTRTATSRRAAGDKHKSRQVALLLSAKHLKLKLISSLLDLGYGESVSFRKVL